MDVTTIGRHAESNCISKRWRSHGYVRYATCTNSSLNLTLMQQDREAGRRVVGNFCLSLFNVLPRLTKQRDSGLATLRCSSRVATDFQIQNQVIWNGLKRSRYDELALPIPQSNTNAAKQMRCVAIMANIARAIDTYILQPTDFLPSNGGLRGLLARQAQDESRQEAALRAMFQALLLTQQDTTTTSRIAEACNNVMHDVGGLLPREVVATFKGELIDIVENTRDIWRQVRRSRDAVEPSFVRTQYSDWH